MLPANVAPENWVWPDHKTLPCEDDSMPAKIQDHPQANLLTESLLPRLKELHPDGRFLLGHDNFIYWRVTKPPMLGAKSPDWFLVPGVDPMPEGECRRSFVMWQERGSPQVVVEFVSGDGKEERDTTPETGKFWVYERGIRAPYYAIYDITEPAVEMFHLVDGGYVAVEPNEAGRLPIPKLGVELGLWEGTYRGLSLPWLRFWDAATGELMPNEAERIEEERKRTVEERQRADEAESLIDDFRTEAEEVSQRAELERKRAEAAEAERDKARSDLEKLRQMLRAAGLDPESA